MKIQMKRSIQIQMFASLAQSLGLRNQYWTKYVYTYICTYYLWHIEYIVAVQDIVWHILYGTIYIFQDNILRLRLLLQGSQTLISYFLYGNAKQNCHHHEHYHEHHHDNDYANQRMRKTKASPRQSIPMNFSSLQQRLKQHCYCEHLNICYCCEQFRI